MNRTRLGLGGTAITLATVCAWLVHDRPVVQAVPPRVESAFSSSADSMSTHDRDKLGHIQQEIGRLRADNARLHARADALAEAQRNPAAQLTNAQPAGVPSPETAEAVLAREAEAISEQASREPVDAGWAGEAEARLADAFQDLAAVDSSLRLVDVECRSSLCRIDLTAESDVNTTTILARLPWDGARFFRLNREVDGSVTIAGYVAREGFALPSSQARSGGQDPVSR